VTKIISSLIPIMPAAITAAGVVVELVAMTALILSWPDYRAGLPVQRKG
jgi:hypothetical protein